MHGRKQKGKKDPLYILQEKKIILKVVNPEFIYCSKNITELKTVPQTNNMIINKQEKEEDKQLILTVSGIFG